MAATQITPRKNAKMAAFDPTPPVSVSMGIWRELAACRGVDGDWVMVPKKTKSMDPHKAKAWELAHCKRCPVTAECLDFATATGEIFGVWGGLLPDERRAHERRRLADD